jgi:hypothetical protein
MNLNQDMKTLLEHAKLHGEAHAKRTAEEYETALRDTFAGVALQGILSSDNNDIPCVSCTIEEIEQERKEYALNTAFASYRYADAMLEARKKKKGVQDA